MTAEQQEPEYIITREQLTQIANLVYPADYQELVNVFGVIRSRPHSPLQDTTGQKKCVYQGQKDGKLVCAFLMPEPDLYIELTDKIRQDATEKVLGEVREIIGKGLPDTEHTLGRIFAYLREKGR